ncbi:MAG: hypothetical protein WBC44_22060 [Planctomycetaceae bacterium]
MGYSAFAPGTNVRAGTEFVARMLRTGNWFRPDASQAAPGWRRTLERLQDEFRDHARQYRPIRGVLFQQLEPNAVETKFPDYAPNELCGFCTGIGRQTGQLFSPDGTPLMGEWPVPDATGKPIATSAGEAFGWRFGFVRTHVLTVARSHAVGDNRLESDGGYFVRAATEASGVLRGLPAGIAVDLWRNWPEGFDPPHDEALWLDALHELALRPGTAGPLSAKPFADTGPHMTIGLLGEAPYPLLPPRRMFVGIPDLTDGVPALHGNPYRWHSALEDLARASVAAIDLLLSLPEDGGSSDAPTATNDSVPADDAPKAAANGDAKPKATVNETTAGTALKPAEERAWQAYKLAESKWDAAGGRMTDEAAWDWLKEHGPDEYDPPGFETFGRYVRAGRAAHGAGVNHPRAGRTGRSIVGAHDLGERSGG